MDSSTRPVFRSRSQSQNVDWRLRLILLGFAVFIAGGLYFGYIFVSIGFELLALQTGANVPVLPPAPAVGPINPNPDTAVAAPANPARPGERVNVLLLGLDRRPSEVNEPARSDVMIIASLDPRSKTAVLLSLPRDLWVPIPQSDGVVIHNKLNTAHFFAEYNNGNFITGTDLGPNAAMRTVEYNLGVPIHYYARIDFKGFEKAIDLVGGLDINVPKRIVDEAYPLEDDAGIMTLVFEPGLQHMDGERVLQYARTRHQDSDFGRMERQRQVLAALRDRGMSFDLIPRLPQLISTLQDSMDTDIPLDQILNLANIMRNVPSQSISSADFAPPLVEEFWPAPDAQALRPNQELIAELIDKLFFDSAVSEENAAIELQNGTTRDGLAANTSEMLKQRGFKVQRVRQAETNAQKFTTIYNYTGKDHTVNQLASILHVDKSRINRVARPAGVDVDIRVVLGQDAVALE